MKKIIPLIALWLLVCNAGFRDGRQDYSGAGGTVGYTPDNSREYTNVMVEGTTAIFKAIANSNDTIMRVQCSTSVNFPDAGLIESDEGTYSAPMGDVRTVTVTGLAVGTKYYYKTLYRTTSTTYNATGYCPADGCRSFTTPVAPGTSFKFIVVSDSHLGGDSAYDPTAIKTDITTGTAGIEPFAAGIKKWNPNLVVWAGDEITGDQMVGSDATADADLMVNHPATAEETQNMWYVNFFLGCANLGIPMYYAPGNHEKDFGEDFHLTNGVTDSNWGLPGRGTRYTALQASAFDTMDDYPYTLRNKYLISPQGAGKGVDARYGYIDYGDARLIFLTPYPYSTEAQVVSSNCPYDLGATQRAWYQNAVTSFTGKWVFVFIHQVLKGSVLLQGAKLWSASGYTYGWGALGTAANGGPFPDNGCNPDLFGVLESSVADKFLMIGHSHAYVREQWENMYMYTLPSVRRSDYINGNNAAQLDYYYGATDAESDYVAGERANIAVEVDDSKVTVYGINADGSINEHIPIDVFSKGSYAHPVEN